MDTSQLHEGNGTAAAGSNTAQQVHDDIEQTLGARTSTHGTTRATLEAAVKDGAGKIWQLMKRHPFVAVTALGVGGMSAAAAFGVAELAFGGALAFAAYKVLRQGEPPMKAIEETEREIAS